MLKQTHQNNGLFVVRLFLASFILVLLLKLFLASVLDLYSDEIFYWQASSRPALAYSDLPFMTALLIGLGSSLSPENSLAARLFFLILGSSLPFLVFWIALPISSKRQAWESALLSLCLPLGGFLGLLAVPDVPLLFFGLLSLGFFERALRTDKLEYWLGTGLFVACGLSTHYRFFLYPAAVILFLVWHSEQRTQWLNPKFWLAIIIACAGLIPILWFNLSNQLSSVSFYFIDRHSWEFQSSGLLHIFKQAGLVTPPLYALFLATLWQLLKKAGNGDSVAALFLTLSLTNLLVYLVLAPWTDATSTSIHWPLSGYFPLLIFAPMTLRVLREKLSNSFNPKTLSYGLWSIPLIGFLGTLVALLGVGSQAFQQQLQPLVGTDVLSNKMAGWKEFSQHTRELISQEFSGHEPVIITDNYYTSAQAEFANLSVLAYTLDEDKALRDGRIAQYILWDLGESGLNNSAGEAALFITEDSTLDVPDKQLMLSRMCRHIDELNYLGELSLFAGDKKFSFYKAGRIIDLDTASDYRSSPCPFPARAWIDYPEADTIISGVVNVRGWSYNEDIGIREVRLVLDGNTLGAANYGANRSDVVDVMKVQSDPNTPNFGFEFEFDSSKYENGSHRLSLLLINHQQTVMPYGERTIAISNP